MEKKQLLSVVKPLIAAALLFGSSGGVAWGQIYKSQRNPDKAQASADKKERAQLRGGIGGGIDANAGGQSCSTDYTVLTSFTVENNYGPGESGTLTPDGDNAGIWSSPDTNQGFNFNSGRITLGGTTNHVGHRTTGANYNGFLSGRGTSTGPVTATANLVTTSGCTPSSAWTGSAFDPKWDGHDYSYYNDGRLGITGGSTVSLSYSWGPATISISRPTVPDGSGVTGANTNPVYTQTTAIIADASSKNPNAPWKIQQFQFMPNPWYFYNTSFTYPSVSHRVEFTYTKINWTCSGSSPFQTTTLGVYLQCKCECISLTQ